MISKTAAFVAGALVLTAALPAAAQDLSLLAARVGGPDPAMLEKQGKFYQNVLGLQETGRQVRPTDPHFLEIIMNFGATPEAARAAKTPLVVLITAPQGAVFPHPTSNLIFRVPDAKAMVDKAVANGGSVEREPSPPRSAPPGTKGPLIAFIKDPAGNRIELVQP